jgi:phosphoribosylamine--glycine ligase
LKKVEERIVKPTIQGLRDRRIDYKGFIFLGLMNREGDPYVIEYNVRMGDPEAEVVLPRIKTDFVELLKATAEGRLSEMKVELDKRTVATVMLVSGGYPGSYEKGKAISGLEAVDDSILFHAGTRGDNGRVLSSGGRVIAVSSYGDSMQDALATSYKNAERVRFDGKYYRSDIGFDL